MAFQPPVAAQEVALVELQFKVVELPLVMIVARAVSEAVGTTLIVTLDTALVPPAPVHFIE